MWKFLHLTCKISTIWLPPIFLFTIHFTFLSIPLYLESSFILYESMNYSLPTIHFFVFSTNVVEGLSSLRPCHWQREYRRAKEKFSLFMGFMLRETDKKQTANKIISNCDNYCGEKKRLMWQRVTWEVGVSNIRHGTILQYGDFL